VRVDTETNSIFDETHWQRGAQVCAQVNGSDKVWCCYAASSSRGRPPSQRNKSTPTLPKEDLNRRKKGMLLEDFHVEPLW